MFYSVCCRTKETLASGNLLSVINVLMQLRKVCNHPNLFEVRPTVSPFQMEAIEFVTASLAWSALDYHPFKVIVHRRVLSIFIKLFVYENLYKNNYNVYGYIFFFVHKKSALASSISDRTLCTIAFAVML